MTPGLKLDFIVPGNPQIKTGGYIYDHRIIDGKESVGFLVAIKEALENPIEHLMGGKDGIMKNLGL